jgi:WD40 repeat protein
MTTTPDALADRLTRLDVFEHAARAGALPDLIAGLDEARAALGPDRRAGVLWALGAALRLDLAFLVEHPEATFSCLYNRCFWHASPAARLFFDRLGDPPAPGHDLLLGVAEEWRVEHDDRGTVWVRSLRPPEVALGGALTEEYRGVAGQFLQRLRLPDGGQRIELFHDPAPPLHGRGAARRYQRTIWDRATGRGVAGEPLELADEQVSPDGRFRVRPRTWDGADLIDEATSAILGRLDISDTRNASAVAYTRDGDLVALAGWDEDAGGFVVVFDLGTRRPLLDLDMSRSLFEVALSPRGDLVAASSAEQTLVWDVRTCQLLLALPLEIAALAFSDDGLTLVTAESGVVRVWDLRRAVTSLRGCRRGLSPAAFSPDGQRLVTGTWLCHGVTGHLVASLDAEMGHYLLGGPPLDFFRIGDARMVSVEGGVTVWDARTGAPIARDHDRHYTQGDLVAISPDGARYALTRAARFDSRGGDMPVRILDTVTGSTLVTFTTSEVAFMSWSPDGRRLATGSADGRVSVWDSEGGRLVRALGGHPTDVTSIAFVKGGDFVVSGARDDAERIWHVDTGIAVAARPLGEGDPGGTMTREGITRSYREWSATPETLEAVRRRLGDPPDPVPWEAVRRGGSTAFVDRRTGSSAAFLPANEPLRRHPTEPIWAGGPVHMRLEGPRR